MSSTGSTPIPRGWYPDPSGTTAWRWWDGSAWTEHTSAPAPSAPEAYLATAYPAYQPARAVPSVYDRFSSEMKTVPWGKLAFLAFVLVAVAQLLTVWAEASWFRHAYDVIRTTPTGVTPVLPTQSSRLALASQLTLLVEAAFYVALCIWQFHAAKTAPTPPPPSTSVPRPRGRRMVHPDRQFLVSLPGHSGLLCAGDPGRQVVGRMWACFVGALIMNLVTDGFALVGNPVGFVFAAVSFALACGFSHFGIRTVGLIAAAHQRLLYPGQSATQP